MAEHQFSGELAEPLEPVVINNLFRKDGEDFMDLYRYESDKRRQIEYRKVALLMEHYELDGSEGAVALLRLVISMAREFVPGFKERNQKRRGAKTKWTSYELRKIRSEVDKLIEHSDSAIGIKQACIVLAKNEYWSSFIRQNEGTYGPSEPWKTGGHS